MVDTTRVNEPPPVRAPIRLAGFRLVHELGSGGAGSVWLGQQDEPRRLVAIKLVPVTAGAADHLGDEADLLARLSHPNLVDVYQAGVQDGYCYIVMPYLEGGTLDDRLSRGKLDEETVTAIGTQVASALTYLHSEGLVHRDIKPANILFDRHGNALLADFGIAKQARTSGERTQQGLAVGTPAYMSPEQIRCEPLDGRSDLYSLGAVLYECLTGSPPFSASNTHDLLQQHLTQKPLRLRNVRDSLARIVERLLAKAPQQRFDSAKDLQLAIEKTDSADLLDAFRRKRVLRNSGMYLFGAWVLLQVMDVLGDIWELTSWTKRGLFFVLVSGLPLVALASWVADFGEDTAGIRRFRRLLGRRYRAGVGALVIVGFTMATFLAVHAWPDEPLDPEVRNFVLRAAAGPGRPDNFYYGLWGLAAPPGEDIFRYGRFHAERGERLRDWTMHPETLATPTLPCRIRELGCIEQLAMLPYRPDGSERLLVERYLQLRKAADYSSIFTWSYDSQLPPYQLLMQAAELRLHQVISVLQQQGVAEAWPILESDMAFHRLLLEESQLVIDKMISVAVLEAQILVYSLLLEADPMLPELRRLTERERSMLLPFSSEFTHWPEGGKEEIAAAEPKLADDDFVSRVSFHLLPLRKNRALNRYGGYALRLSQASILSPGEFYRMHEKLVPPPAAWDDWIFNGAGMVVDSMDSALVDWRDYIYRAHSPDLSIILATVKRRALQEGISPALLPVWLRDLPDGLQNPFTGDPPAIREGVLYFDPPHDVELPRQARIPLRHELQDIDP